MPQLAAMGILAKSDLAVLAVYCERFALYARLVPKLALADLATESGRRLSISTSDALKQMLSAAGELGLTPCARTRIHAQAPEKDPKDNKGKYFHLQTG